jgi:hypothetical protein
MAVMEFVNRAVRRPKCLFIRLPDSPLRIEDRLPLSVGGETLLEMMEKNGIRPYMATEVTCAEVNRTTTQIQTAAETLLLLRVFFKSRQLLSFIESFVRAGVFVPSAAHRTAINLSANPKKRNTELLEI